MLNYTRTPDYPLLINFAFTYFYVCVECVDFKCKIFLVTLQNLRALSSQTLPQTERFFSADPSPPFYPQCLYAAVVGLWLWTVNQSQKHCVYCPYSVFIHTCGLDGRQAWTGCLNRAFPVAWFSATLSIPHSAFIIALKHCWPLSLGKQNVSDAFSFTDLFEIILYIYI